MSELISQTTVIEMGFTKAMIKKLLPSPIEKPNPFYKSAAPMKMFNKDDVEKVMQTDAYKLEYEKSQKRKSAAAKAVKTKEEALFKEVSEMSESIRVKVIPDDKLINNAIISYNNHLREKAERNGDYGRIYRNSPKDIPEETLHRLVVNYIRHHLTTYDKSLLKLKGKVGKQEGYVTYKEVILQKIALAYPKYKDECQRQINEIPYY